MHETDARLPAMSRRELMACTVFVPLSSLTASAQQSRLPALSVTEMRILEAFIDRLIPADELGPGAVEAGVHVYIDRTLAEGAAAVLASFRDGLQGLDAYSQRTRERAFADLSAADRDAIVVQMENGTADGFSNARAVFARIRTLTLEGMFGDPFYGGNRNFAGWDLVRYPGPRLAVAPEDQALKQEIKPYRKSAFGGEHGR